MPKPIVKKDVVEMRKKAAGMVGKTFEFVSARKALSIDSEKKTAVFVLSTSDPDRHEEIVDQDSWILEPFRNSSMPFLFQHDSSDGFPIGGWTKLWLEPDLEKPGKNMLVGEVEFAYDYDDRAKKAFHYVEKNWLAMVSAGFIPHRVEYDETLGLFVLYDNELLEGSLVTIGSNRRALIRSQEELEVKKKDAEQSEIKKKLIDLKLTLELENDNIKSLNRLKARELLNKAIRQLDK